MWCFLRRGGGGRGYSRGTPIEEGFALLIVGDLIRRNKGVHQHGRQPECVSVLKRGGHCRRMKGMQLKQLAMPDKANPSVLVSFVAR